jgi:hypothetical protein
MQCRTAPQNFKRQKKNSGNTARYLNKQTWSRYCIGRIPLLRTIQSIAVPNLPIFAYIPKRKLKWTFKICHEFKQGNMEGGHLSILARNSYHVQLVCRIPPYSFHMQTKEPGSNDVWIHGHRSWQMYISLKGTFIALVSLKTTSLLIQLMFWHIYTKS